MSQKFVLFFFFIFLTVSGFSQRIKSFDEDIEKYPEVVAGMFPANVSEDDKALISQFNSDWSGGVFTNNEKIDIIRISNAFLGKSARNIHYWMFWRCMLSFKKPENSGKGYDAWIKALDATCQDRRSTPTSLQTLMTATLSLLDKRAVYSSAGNEWKSSNDDYRFEFANDQLSVVFGACDLYCYSKGDSIMIGQTTGRYSMNNQQWKGKGGTVTWERAGYAPADVSARLNDYTINMKQSQYEADSVWLTHATYFSSPVMGKLIDNVRKISNPESALHPEFITYNNKFVFNDLYPNVNYEGGISIQGARVIGSGTDDEKATISIQRGDSLKMNVKSKSFVFTKERIEARNVSLNIRMMEDSIIHNNLLFRYLVNTREVNLTRADVASSRAPYFNSYHEVNMDFEQLIWKIDEPLMSLSTSIGSAGGRAQFRSLNFFNQNYFESMQYFDAAHPLISIRQCAANWGIDPFPSEMYARQIRRPVSEARGQLIEIAKQGFIIFDGDKDVTTVLPRLYDFLAAASKRADFDVIDLRSSVVAPSKNATLNVQNYDLFINGIEKFMVSDSQQVVITPRNQQIVMKKNRSIDFDGLIDAGQVELRGDSLHFNYEDFKIDLRKIDSLYFFVPVGEKDAFGQVRQQRLKTAVENLTGTILIDMPDNKSGRESMKEYPVLISDSVSYVYYASPDIAGGAYDPESFYFGLDPFVLDNIDNLTKESIALTGQFVSGGIFNDMRQTLFVQPDYSLGFVHESDSAISAYTDAQLFAEIQMSNKGLKASGKLDYLTASIHTNEFNLYPDSMDVAAAKEFIIRKQTDGTEFPDVRSEGNRIHWETKKEKMYIYKKDKNFDMYNPETQFDGSFLLTPEGLSGKGRMDVGASDIRSDNIAFKANTFSSDTSVFRLRAAKNAPVQLTTVDTLRSDVDFNSRKGNFVPAAGKDYTLVQFPANRFAAYAEGMIWDMDGGKVSIGAEAAARPAKAPVPFKYQHPDEGEGTRFYSTARDADSLNFVASRTTLDLAQGTLQAEGVNIVKTSDAIIYPGNGELTVTPEGSLDNIRNARIVFNDEMKQHTIYDADVRIRGRKQFSGFGKYDYVDETEQTFVLDISKIETDRTGKTIATGTVPADSSFMLSPYFRYRGNLTLSSDEQFPVFDGATQIIHECGTLIPAWFRFKSPINPAMVQFPVDEAPVALNNSKIYSGLFLTNDSSRIYPAFLSSRRTYSDNQLVDASGMLTYDKDSMMYFIAPESKLRNRDTIGNLIAFDRDRCLLTGEGQIMLGVDLGRVKTDVAGRIVHNLGTHETMMDAIMSINFHFDNGLAGLIATTMSASEILPGVDMQRTTYIRGMNQWLGVRRAETFRRDASLGRVTNFPAELSKTIVLTQLRMFWNQSTRSWRSSGKIGVGNLFGFQVNRQVDGMIEITKRLGGDQMDIYLKLDDNNWYYFGYTRELMQVLSSDNEFNERLKKIPEKQRTSEDKRPGFRYMIASGDKLNQFMRIYQQRDEQSDPFHQSQPAIRDAGQPAVQPAAPVRNEDDVKIIEVE